MNSMGARGFISSPFFGSVFRNMMRNDRQGQCQTQSFLVFAMRKCVCVCVCALCWCYRTDVYHMRIYDEIM